MVLNKNVKVFIVYIIFLNLGSKILIHQVYKVQINLLIVKKVIILAKYLDYINIFSKKLAAKLLK